MNSLGSYALNGKSVYLDTGFSQDRMMLSHSYIRLEEKILTGTLLLYGIMPVYIGVERLG